MKMPEDARVAGFFGHCRLCSCRRPGAGQAVDQAAVQLMAMPTDFGMMEFL